MKKRDSGSFSSPKFNSTMAMLSLKTTQMKNSINFFKVISWDAAPPSNSDHQDVFMICRGSAFTNPRVWGASQFFPPSQSHQKKIPFSATFFQKTRTKEPLPSVLSQDQKPNHEPVNKAAQRFQKIALQDSWLPSAVL